MSSCSCWSMVGCRTHFPQSISTLMSSSKSIFLSVVVPVTLLLVGVVGQRSVKSWWTAAKPVAFLRELLLLGHNKEYLLAWHAPQQMVRGILRLHLCSVYYILRLFPGKFLFAIQLYSDPSSINTSFHCIGLVLCSTLS